MAYHKWETPQDLFNTLNLEFGFDVDVCAEDSTAKCKKYYTVIDNGLAQHWSGVCWMNPPYDRSIGEWVKKAYESAQNGATVVCLLPGRSSDTRWWHDYVMKSREIRYIKGRLEFLKNDVAFGNCNISSVVVVFSNGCNGRPICVSIDTKGNLL